MTENYVQNITDFDNKIRIAESFDLVKKRMPIGSGEVTIYYVDGLIKDAVMQKMISDFALLSDIETGAEAAHVFADKHVSCVEVDITDSEETMITMLLSGCTLILGSTFGKNAIIIDARTYPARMTQEPESDKVIRGSRDGFVETLIMNTALIRRRIRDTNLTFSYHTVGRASKSDVVIVYVAGRANDDYVKKITKKIAEIDTDALTMGHQSLVECLIKHRWYNPLPKTRTTERPDAACAQLLEGSVIVLVDNSPEAMILPTSIFDFMQESDDYYLPPMTGCYLRILRQTTLFLALFVTPLWYVAISNSEILPSWLHFVIPVENGRLPIIVQIMLAEFIIDVMKLASLNTPSVFANSMSVVAGLILGDFAVDIGWFIPEVILYMAFVAIANFTQPSFELSFSFKLLRMFLLLTSAIGGLWGFAAGMIIIFILLATNTTVNGDRSYLYPLIPFNGRALLRMLFRVKKND